MNNIEKLEKIIEDKEKELEELNKRLNHQKIKNKTNEANELLNKYKDRMLEVIELGKKQQELLDKIYDEVYDEYSERCQRCSEMYDWEKTFEYWCPFAFVCGLKCDSSLTYLLDNEYEDGSLTEDIIKNKVYTEKQIEEVM